MSLFCNNPSVWIVANYLKNNVTFMKPSVFSFTKCFEFLLKKLFRITSCWHFYSEHFCKNHPNIWMHHESVYPKCHFVFLLNWKLKFEILISEFRFYTKFEKQTEKGNGFSIFKIIKIWNSTLQFVFRFSF